MEQLQMLLTLCTLASLIVGFFKLYFDGKKKEIARDEARKYSDKAMHDALERTNQKISDLGEHVDDRLDGMETRLGDLTTKVEGHSKYEGRIAYIEGIMQIKPPAA